MNQKPLPNKRPDDPYCECRAYGDKCKCGGPPGWRQKEKKAWRKEELAQLDKPVLR